MADISIKKANAYYDNTMYLDKQGADWTHRATKEIYNPIPDIVSAINFFTKKGLKFITPKSLEASFALSEDINNYSKLTGAMNKKQVLEGGLYVEIIQNEYINIVSKEKVTSAIFNKSKVKYAKVIGVTNSGVNVTKEYFYGDFEGVEKKVLIQTLEGKEPVSIPMPEMLLIYIPSSYNLKNIFNKIDRINEFRQFIYAISKANGEPKLLLKLMMELTDEQKDTLATVKNFDEMQKIMASQNADADAEYIELKGQIITYMQSQIDDVKKEIDDAFPEIALMDSISGSNISFDTAVIKLTVIESKIKELRDELKNAYTEIFKIIFKTTEIEVGFDSIIPQDRINDMEAIRNFYLDGAISLDTYINKLQEYGFIEDAEAEIKAPKLSDLSKYENLYNMGLLSKQTFMEKLQSYGMIKNVDEELKLIEAENTTTDEAFKV